MLSVNQTASSYTALSTLKQISKDLQTTQDRIATGLKVSSAADNATVWSTAQNLRSDIKVQDTYKAGMTTAKAKADVASASLDKVLDILQKMKDTVANAVDRTDTNFATLGAATEKELTTYKAQLLATIKGASLDGTNLLTGTTGLTVKIGKDGANDINMVLTISDVVLDTTTTTSTATLGGAASYSSVYNLSSFSDSTAVTGTTAANKTAAATAINTAITTITAARNNVAAFSSALESQADFMQKMTDIRKSALSDLVDADMSEEAAKVSALQVKQQLAYQALSIGNNSSQNILRLFQ